MARRVNARGRNTNWRGVALDEWFLGSPAYRDLSGDARALYIEFRRRYSPSRNGAIPFSIREMAKSINRTEKTATKALNQLISHGFVRRHFKGAFSLKIQHASEWELTEYPIGENKPKKDFMKFTGNQKKRGGISCRLR